MKGLKNGKHRSDEGTGSYCGSFQPVCSPKPGTQGTCCARRAEGGRGVPVDEAVARIVEHIRNRVNEDPKPSTEAAE